MDLNFSCSRVRRGEFKILKVNLSQQTWEIQVEIQSENSKFPRGGCVHWVPESQRGECTSDGSWVDLRLTQHPISLFFLKRDCRSTTHQIHCNLIRNKRRCIHRSSTQHAWHESLVQSRDSFCCHGFPYTIPTTGILSCRSFKTVRLNLGFDCIHGINHDPDCETRAHTREGIPKWPHTRLVSKFLFDFFFCFPQPWPVALMLHMS